MDAYKKTHQALCVYGELKRARAAGGDDTRAFLAQVAAALSQLTTEEQIIIQSIYIMQMTNEETAESADCDPSTVSRRKRRAIDRLTLYLYPDAYIQQRGLQVGALTDND